MKVKKLYIIVFGPDDELTTSGVALRQRYLPKVTGKGGAADDVVLISVDGFLHPFTIRTLAGRHSPPVTEPDLGIYLLGHSTAAGGIMGLADGGGALIRTQLQIQSVRKLCYVACALARTIKDEDPADDQVEDAAEEAENPAVKKCVLEAYCTDLHNAGLDPAVAGWDTFVSVCAGDNPEQWTKDEVRDLRDRSPKSAPANFGRKIFGPSRRLVKKQEDRTKHKKAFQWVQAQGGATRLGLSGWHDN